MCMCPGTHMEVPGQLLGINSRSLPRGSQGLDVVCFPWRQEPLYAEPSPWPLDFSLIKTKTKNHKLTTISPVWALNSWSSLRFSHGAISPDLFVCLFVFRDRVSLCSPSCPGTHSVDQAGLELRNLPASASQVLGLKACTTTARWYIPYLSSGSEITNSGWFFF